MFASICRCPGPKSGGVDWDCGGTPLGAGKEDAKDKKTRRPAGGKPRDDRDMGAALRSVYQRTVEEDVPDEFLDLLGKLD